MTLLSIYLNRLRNSEFIQFITDLLSIFQKQNAEELGIKEQIDPISPELEKMKVIHSTSTSSEISDELKAIDNRRDDCITGIRSVLDGYTYHYDNTIADAAQSLLNKIDTFGTGIARQNYPTETTSMQGIYESFTKEEKLKKALSLLNLTEWAGQMDKENTFFNTRYIDRVDETSKQTNDKIIALRKSIVEKYFTLREHLAAHSIVKKDVNYKVVTDQLNTLIETYNGIIKRRGGNNKGDNTNTPDNTDTPKK